ncbi:MAG: glycosyltransferase family A protein [Chloroflexota bacterium]|nr:glycosyltransferase family A protein [Chloroflexota bacterium]
MRKILERDSRNSNNSNRPTVSVVIPVYDRTNLLIESIESVLSQTITDFELLLVCDGSPEDTLHIVKNYEDEHSNIRAFYLAAFFARYFRPENNLICCGCKLMRPQSYPGLI